MKKEIIRSVMAGVFIGLGGAAFALCPDPYVGAFVFAMGLYLVCAFGMNLFTGRVGYFIDDPTPSNAYKLASMWAGNFVGAAIVATIVRFARPDIIPITSALVDGRLAQSGIQTFCHAVLCGALVYCSVADYRQGKKPLAIMLCIPIFVACKYEHCIADMFYMATAMRLGAVSIFHILLVTLGNTAGAFATHIAIRATS